MSVPTASDKENTVNSSIDWVDIKFILVLGIVTAAVKVAEYEVPGWHLTRHTTDIIACLLTVGYILGRGRRSPEKLDTWGITRPLSATAWGTGLLLLALSAALLATTGYLLAGTLSFESRYITEMVEYIPAAFPQQFVLCSVVLTSLATLPVFQGKWRLSIVVGVAFSLAHFWTPARIPGTFIPVQMLITLPAGFGAALYFLTYRNILPLTAIHAVFYPLMHHWIEQQLG